MLEARNPLGESLSLIMATWFGYGAGSHAAVAADPPFAPTAIGLNNLVQDRDNTFAINLSAPESQIDSGSDRSAIRGADDQAVKSQLDDPSVPSFPSGSYFTPVIGAGNFDLTGSSADTLGTSTGGNAIPQGVAESASGGQVDVLPGTQNGTPGSSTSPLSSPFAVGTPSATVPKATTPSLQSIPIGSTPPLIPPSAAGPTGAALQPLGGAVSLVTDVTFFAQTGIKEGQMIGGSESLGAKVATFTHSDKYSNAGDFRAVVDWGDDAGVADQTPGEIVPVGGGEFEVRAKYAYKERSAPGEPYTVTVAVTTLSDDKGASVTGNLPIVDALLTASDKPFTTGVGTKYAGAITTFTDENTLSPAANFTAEVTWGDGDKTVLSGDDIRPLGAGAFAVLGDHRYKEAKQFSAVVKVLDVDGSTATVNTTATVGAAIGGKYGVNISPTEGAEFKGEVAWFQTADLTAQAADFEATVAWGDGATSMAPDVQIVPRGDLGTFSVASNHVYATSGGYTITVTVSAVGGFGNGGFTIESSALVVGATITVTGKQPDPAPVAGISYTGIIATFTDAATTSQFSSDNYKAIIDWDNGYISQGNTSLGDADYLNITGSTLYEQPGDYAVAVTVVADDGGKATTSINLTVDPHPITALVFNTSAITDQTPGDAFWNGTLGHFNANPYGSASDYSVQIDWGDGSKSNGVVYASGDVYTGKAPGFDTQDPRTPFRNSRYDICAEHAHFPIYDNPALNSTLVTYTVTDKFGQTAKSDQQYVLSSSPYTTPYNPHMSFAPSSEITVYEGDQFFIQIGILTHSKYNGEWFRMPALSVYWDDGQLGGTSVVQLTSTTFEVWASHLYSELPGPSYNNNSYITYFDAYDYYTDYYAMLDNSEYYNGHLYTEGPTIHVLPRPLDATSLRTSGVTIAGMPDVPLSNVVVANVSAALSTYSDLKATITWGDGSSDVVTPSNGKVVGSHTYVAAGMYGVKVTVEQTPPVDLDKPTLTSTAEATAVIQPGKLVITPRDTLVITAGLPVPQSPPLFTITDPQPNTTAADYQATIYWGDGQVTDSSSVIISGGPNTFSVIAPHTYAVAGDYACALVVRKGDETDWDWFEVKVNPTTTTPPPNGLVDVNIKPLVIEEGEKIDRRQVATFQIRDAGQSVASFSAVVDWGDGSTSPAEIKTIPGTGREKLKYEVLGSHTYWTGGVYPLKVTIVSRNQECPDTDANSTALVLPATLKGFTLESSATRMTWSGYEPKLKDVVVAQWFDPDASPVDEYAATIEWGDGASSAGKVIVHEHQYYVLGSHQYEHEGDYNYKVRVVRTDFAKSVIGVVNVRPVSVGLPAIPAVSSGVISTFFNGNRVELPYEGGINWGGPERSTVRHWGVPGTIWGMPGSMSGGAYSLTESQLFRTEGLRSTQTYVIDDKGDASVSDTWAYTVADAPHYELAQRPKIFGLKGIDLGLTSIATFTDDDPAASAALFQADIDWGDGSTPTTGVIETAPDGTFIVKGAHRYPLVGEYSVSVLIRETSLGGSSIGTLGLATLARIADTNVKGEWFAALSNYTTGDIVLGAVTDSTLTSNNTSVSVDWGDGTNSAGRLQRTGPASFEVVSAHNYSAFSVYSGSATISSGVSTYTFGGLIPVYRASLETTQRTADPDRADFVSLGGINVDLNAGGVRVMHPLDFDLSPGTSVGRSPSLVYNSAAVAPRPVIEMSLTGLGPVIPKQLNANFSLADRKTQAYSSFNAGGSTGWKNYIFGVQADKPVTEHGAYDWRSHVRVEMGANKAPVEVDLTGRAVEAVQGDHPEIPTPLGAGWGIAGVDRLVSECHGDVLWVTGESDVRVFANNGNGTFSSPEDFGKLEQIADKSFTYTARDATVETFNAAGLMTKVVSPLGLTVTYSYDAVGRLEKVKTPDQGVTSITYTKTQVIIAEPGNRGVTLDVVGKRLTVIHDADSTKHYTGAEQAIDPDGSDRAFAYGSDGRLVADTWAPFVTVIGYDSKTGLVESVDRGLGTKYDLTPSPAQSLLGAINLLDGSKTAVATRSGPLNPTTTYTFDTRGRTLKLDAPLQSLDRWERNGAGDPTWHDDPLNQQTRSAYSGDGKGDLTSLTYADGATRSFAYHAKFGSVKSATDELGRVTTTDYNPDFGYVTVVTRPLGDVTTYSYDAATKLLQTSKDALDRVTKYAYDANRRLHEVTDAVGAVVITTYDGAGNPYTTVTNPSLTGLAAEQRTTTTVYDGRNQLVRTTDALGGQTTSTYLASGRTDKVTDPLGRSTTYSYDRRGLQTGMTEGIAATQTGIPAAQRSETEAYDAAGRVLSVTRGLAPANPTIDAGAFSPIPYQHVTTTRFAYDALDRKTAEYNGWVSSTDYLSGTTYAYDRAGQLRWERSGQANGPTSPNPLLTRYGYDLRGRQGQVIEAVGDVGLERTTTSVFDKVGNVTELIDPLASVNKTDGAYILNGYVTKLQYDAHNRVTLVSEAYQDTLT